MTSAEAKKRLEQYGPNALPEKPPPSDFTIFIAQLKSPLVYILLVAGLVTFFLREYSDTTIIFFAVFVNTVLGFIQERKASKALDALKKLIHPRANVIRDGKTKEIDVAEVVPGDIVVLHQGDKIPAGGEVVEANRFFTSEAILTGESVPIEKKVKEGVYMGTIATSGIAKMEVKVTGEKTEIGKIALSVQELDDDTPLRRQLAHFSRQLTYLVLGLTVFVFIIGLLTGKDIVEILLTSVALAVASIPEGLLVGLTAVLAIGMQRILSKRGLVRRLVSAETLGGVTTICADKTGTLTEGEMRVVDSVGNEDDISTQMILANDLDDPIVIAGWDWALAKLKTPSIKFKVSDFKEKHKRIDSIPFSSKERLFVSLNKWGNLPAGGNMLFVNGAPDFILNWCKLSKQDKEKIRLEIERLTSQGKRLLGLARKEFPATQKKLNIKDAKNDLEWVGILAFSDPVRPGVREALEKTKTAGIRLIVITGDYPQTAASVMKELGIEVDSDSTVLGTDLAEWTADELSEKLKKHRRPSLFARTTPEQKLKIVDALKKNGEVVAMTGDGVNDAPALNRADIGIVVGEATDVAKETADLVLLDSSFSTVVSAIEEGRGMFDNIRKIIIYLLADGFEEIVAVIATLIFHLPLPVSAAQILWINIVSDGFPHLALTVDPKEPGIMQKSPRDPKQPLVNSFMKKLIFLVSLEGGIVAFSVFYYFLKTTGDTNLARSVAFATLGINSLIYVFSIRILEDPFWKENPFDNKWLNMAVIAGLIFQVFPFLFEPTRKFLEIEKLTLSEWSIVFGAGLFMFGMIEISKYVFRHKLVLKHQ